MRTLRHFKLTLIFWLCGALCLVGAAAWGGATRSVESWPTERARVLRSEIVSSQVGSYRGQVEVELASGRRESLELPFASSSQSVIEEALQRTPPGLELLVFVSPHDGARVRLPLAPHDYLGPGILAVLGVMLGVAPLLTVMVAERSQTPVVASRALYGTAVLLLLLAVAIGWQRTQMLSWPAVEASVLEHRAVSQPSRYAPPRHWAPVLTVRYQAAGETVESDIQGERRFRSERSTLEYLQQSYPDGRSVTVHYHPKWPQAATFEASASLRFFAFPALILLFALLSAFLGALAARQKAPGRAARTR